MFAGFNREVRNSMRLLGLRLRYGVAVCEIAVEQYGAAVAANIALRLSSRGTGNIEFATNGIVRQTIDGSGNANYPIQNTILTFSNGGTIRSSSGGLAVGSTSQEWSLNGGAIVSNASVASPFISGFNPGGGSQTARPLTVRGGNARAAETVSPFFNGGSLFLLGGNASSSATGAANGGGVDINGGRGFGSGVSGAVRLGTDGTNVSRVTVRNTIFGLNGYTSSTAAATTTQLPTSGDFGIHKNTTSGDVHLCFNDAGTIRSVLMT
jgi:hypothetical protein